MKNKRKILFISNRGLLPIVDGHTRRSFNILRGLSEKNDVYFLSLSESPEETSEQNLNRLNNLCSAVEFFPAPPKRLSVGLVVRLLRSFVSLDPYTVWRHYSAPFSKRVKELLATKQFDIVHCDILPLCYTVRKEKNVFRSLTDHDVSYLKCLSVARSEKNIFLKIFLFLESYKLKRLEKTVFNQVDLGIVVSDSDKACLENLCKKGNFIVIENGVEIGRFEKKADIQTKDKLIWLGGFNHGPNKQAVIYFLEKVYPLLKSEIVTVSIDIIGGGVTDELKKYAKNDPSINFIGYVDDPSSFIDRATVFVAPILSGGGTKLKVIEAMAAGKAIVSTPVGVEGIAGVHGVHYLVANDAKEFKDAVVLLLNDGHIRDFLQREARKLVEDKYDTEIVAEKLNKVYWTFVSPASAVGIDR